MHKIILKLRFSIRIVFAFLIQRVRNYIYRCKGYDVDKTIIFERKIQLDRLYPAGVHIGKYCLIASGTVILSHDHCKRAGAGILNPLLKDTYIGERCFLAVNSLILPGVHIGDEVVVGAGSVVTKDIPSNCIVAGNPAKVIRTGIRMSKRAEILNWNTDEGWVQ